MKYAFVHSKKLILEPQKGSPWADEMVLNPGIIQDKDSNRIHMLFRATGPWPQRQIPGKPLPYPIFLGYAYSDDLGSTWTPDFTRPALKPELAYEIEGIYIKNQAGERVPNFANGCIEDPRLFWLENKCYVIVACRMLPPGPYWIHDEPTQCSPDWIRTAQNPFGRAASDNVTSNVLYQVDLDALVRGDYEHAFEYVTHLTNAEYGENRDVLLFPEKLNINGHLQYVCLHRPKTPQSFRTIQQAVKPSIMICAANTLPALSQEEDSQTLLASPLFPWEADRIGGSTPPLRISDQEWLLCYHGKQDDKVGYTQSFMILQEQPKGMPKVTHRCSERLIVADQKWEAPAKFQTPCVFITGLIKVEDTLIISYGAADEKAGVAKIDYSDLIKYIRLFDAEGNKKA